MLSVALLVVLVLVALVANSHAHICMWAPAQRGTVEITNPGEHPCYLKVGPCGGVASATPTTTLAGGQYFSVLFQQNLNHYYIENPGKLVVDFARVADPTEEDFVVELGSVSDYNAMNEITQTNFTLPVLIPNVAVDHGVLRLRYFSNNPTENDRGMIFYQCADVSVTVSAEADGAKPAAVAPKAAVPATGSDCCAAKQFTMSGYEVGSWRANTKKDYYFDAVSQMFRVDTISGLGSTPRDGWFSMYSNFTSGIEYYFNRAKGTCDLYGLNYWSDWCYGSANAQVYSYNVTIGNEVADVWTQAGSYDPYFWTNARDSCVPISQFRRDTGESTFYFDFKEGAPDASVFVLPAACVKSEMEFRGRNGDVKSLPKAPVPHHDMPSKH
jgi:hypothetical protein